MRVIRPNALLGLYHCPWIDDEFNHASRRILGLDYDLLVEIVDVFSPMVYHGRMGRNPEWVGDNITWHSNRLNISRKGTPMLWPIVQAHDEPRIISAGEFETVMLGGLAAKSTGVMMFTTRAMASNKSKLAKMKEIYEGY